MDVFLAGTDVTIVVPLVDRSGNPLTVTAIEYRVIDQEGAELLPRTTLNGFVSGSASASVGVPAEKNTLAEDMLRAMRTVELYCTVGGNLMLLHGHYVIETASVLVAGVNSFQNYAQAEFVALSIPNIPGWSGTPEADRIAALIEARRRILKLSFTSLSDARDQSSLFYVAEGTYKTAVPGGIMGLVGDMGELNEAQFNALPPKFLEALRLAQIAEADAILDTDPVELRRQKGLILDAIGESRQMFRDGKPLELPVSKRALGYLSKYISFSKRIGRA